MKPAQTTSGIAPTQIKKLHALKTVLAMDDGAYRTALAACGVSSSKSLSYSGAAELIEDFEGKAIRAGVWKRTGAPVNERRREGFATSAQLELIEALWSEVSTASDKKTALRRFVTRQAKVSDLRFLRDGDTSKVICALRAMQRQKQPKGDGTCK